MFVFPFIYNEKGWIHLFVRNLFDFNVELLLNVAKIAFCIQWIGAKHFIPIPQMEPR